MVASPDRISAAAAQELPRNWLVWLVVSSLVPAGRRPDCRVAEGLLE
jgi:hypothetical protein